MELTLILKLLVSCSIIYPFVLLLTLFLQAGDREMLWVLRISVMVIATLGAITALTVGSVYYLS